MSDVLTELTPQEMVDWANASLDRQKEMQDTIEQQQAEIKRLQAVVDASKPFRYVGTPEGLELNKAFAALEARND